MPTLSVCPRCRETCPKCHTHNKSGHPVWSCLDCQRKFGSKCSACGGTKNGPGSVGAGNVCNKCYKMNTCTFCGKKL